MFQPVRNDNVLAVDVGLCEMGGATLTSHIGFHVPDLKPSREFGFTVGTILSFRFDVPSLREKVIPSTIAGGEVCIFGCVGGTRA